MFFNQTKASSLLSKNFVGTLGLLIFRNKLPIIFSCSLLLQRANAATFCLYSSDAAALLASPETLESSSPSSKTYNFLSEI